MLEAIAIIVSLGGLELVLWLLDRKELREQTALLEEIAVSLSLREANEPEMRSRVVREPETTQAD